MEWIKEESVNLLIVISIVFIPPVIFAVVVVWIMRQNDRRW